MSSGLYFHTVAGHCFAGAVVAWVSLESNETGQPHHPCVVLQSETIVCAVIQQPPVLWGELTLKSLNVILVNQMCTAREMKDIQ